MQYFFFYASLLVVWIVFAVIARNIQVDFRHVVIGAATAAFSVLFDTVFGIVYGLYYYISPGESHIYILLSAVLIYPFINIIYTLFLPLRAKSVILYTTLWIAAMLLFEYLSIKSAAIVFTGWLPLPWSVITYIVTFTWIYFLYRYTSQKMADKPGI